MDKMKMSSPDLTVANIEKIVELFPNVMTEAKDEHGNLVQKIDFEKLKQELSSDVIEGDESYDFTWVGKKQAMVEANKPTNKTLRPCLEDSVNWEKTENLYIEGDNLEVLKLLQESYLNKVKMIYIDPPYNTGNDSFIYPDDYATNKDKYDEEVGAIDESGYRIFKNTETNGRFHSSWCSMMYSRLKVARNLLSDDGVIFISIDDHEVENLKKICDEIFGRGNFVADLIWTNKEGGGSSDSKLFRIKHEHIVCYSNLKEFVDILGCSISNEDRYKLEDEYVLTRGKYYLQKLGMGSIQYSVSLDYAIQAPDGNEIYPADNNNGRKACWRWSKPKFEWGVENGFVEIKKDSQGIWTVYTKQYMNCDNNGNIIKRTQRPMGVIDTFSSTQAAKYMEHIGLGGFFNYAKPMELIKYLLERVDAKDSIILDFFSGSATTAHAVMQLNAEDGGNRKFIMVQLPEVCDEKSEAYKAGYKNICEIGKERIRRAGKKIVEETGKTDLDIGFRVLKLDESNMKNVYYTPDELSQSDLVEALNNIKDGRSGYDLLYQCMLDWGLELSLPHETVKINNNEVHIVNDGDLIACFDDKVSEDTIKQIADKKPLRAVFRDSSFGSPAARINVDEIFKLKSPHTTIKVL